MLHVVGSSKIASVCRSEKSVVKILTRVVSGYLAMKYLTLRGSGGEMPVLGLGTWQAAPQEVEDAVTLALQLGYRHIGQ